MIQRYWTPLKEPSIKKEAHQQGAHKNLNKADKKKSKRKERSCDDKEKQKSISIESTQEHNIHPSYGCKIRMLVGYGENNELNATIITTKEEVDYQFWYPKRNKLIKEYKHIKDTYSWDDEFDFESENAKSTNSPKICDRSAPLKKSRKIETF